MILHFVMTFSSVLMKGMCTYVFYLTCVKGIGLLKQSRVDRALGLLGKLVYPILKRFAKRQ